MPKRRPPIEGGYKITIILDGQAKAHLMAEWRAEIDSGKRATFADTTRRIFHEHQAMTTACRVKTTDQA